MEKQGEKQRMPALFVGHGSPMNAIEDNEFSLTWEKIAKEIPKPEAILSVSAHWYTDGTRVNDSEEPRMVYDMYGFPEELYQVQYPVKGAAKLARYTKELIEKDIKDVDIDNWGIDHGTWSVLCRMYPEADIPVFQLSIDRNAGAEEHFRIGQELSALREKGVMILGSGNVVHNLFQINWDMTGGFQWAVEFDDYIKTKIIARQVMDVVDYTLAGKIAKMAVPTPDHFYPLLYVLGAMKEDDKLTIYNDKTTFGSISMTCYLFK